MSIDDYKMAQGPAKPATPEEIAKETGNKEDTFVGDDITLTFTLSEAVFSLEVVTVDDVEIPSTDYTFDEETNTITFAVAPTDNSEIIVTYTCNGKTKPNLHRRIDNESTPLDDGEAKPDAYELTVQGVNSYRTIKSEYHDEESTTMEIP